MRGFSSDVNRRGLWKTHSPENGRKNFALGCLQTTFSIRVDIFYPPNFRCFEKNGPASIQCLQPIHHSGQIFADPTRATFAVRFLRGRPVAAFPCAAVRPACAHPPCRSCSPPLIRRCAGDCRPALAVPAAAADRTDRPAPGRGGDWISRKSDCLSQGHGSFTDVMGSRARGVAKRSSGFAMRITKPTAVLDGQTGGRVLADRSLSRLLRSDWPRTLDELDALKGNRLITRETTRLFAKSRDFNNHGPSLHLSQPLSHSSRIKSHTSPNPERRYPSGRGLLEDRDLRHREELR